MNRTVLLYGIALAALLGVLKSLEYHFWIRDLRIEVYISIIAILFAALGVWAGLRLTRGAERRPDFLQVTTTEEAPTALLEKYHLSKREFEVLQLIAAGYSNQEIAERLFVSLNTVKTHSSNVFLKLDVKRRTQAVQKAKEIGLL